MEFEPGIKLFGFFTNDQHHLRRNLPRPPPPPPPAVQDQEPESPSTTLSLSIDKPKKIIKRPRICAPDPQHLPPMYHNFVVNNELLGGNNLIELVYSRTLHATDISDHHARLSMPCKQIKEDFLTPGEEELIHQSVKEGKRTLKKKIDVTVVDPSLKIRLMKLAKWNDDDDLDVDDTDKRKRKRKSWWFALTSDWMELVEDNGLVVGDGIQVWSFRMVEGGALGFIIHKINQPAAANDNAGIVISDGSGSSSGSHKEKEMK